MPTQKSSNSTDVHVGQKVRMFRMAKGLSQEKLADQLGLTFQQVQKYEKGINRIGAGRLHAIAMILGVAIADFFDGLPVPGATTGLGNFNQTATSRDGVRILTALNQLPVANRRPVVELVESISALLGG